MPITNANLRMDVHLGDTGLEAALALRAIVTDFQLLIAQMEKTDEIRAKGPEVIEDSEGELRGHYIIEGKIFSKPYAQASNSPTNG